MNLDNITKVDIQIDQSAVDFLIGWCLIEDKEALMQYNDYVGFLSCPFCGVIQEQVEASYHVLILSAPLLERLRSTQKVEGGAILQDAG